MIVDELKKSILEFAFKGKLTKQLDNDTDIDSTLSLIYEQKNQLINDYKIKREPTYTEVNKKEEYFKIPSNWKWIRIGELGIFKKGPFGSSLTKSIFVKDCDNAIKVYEQKNAIQKDVNIGNYFISKEYYEKKMKPFTVETGDVLVSCAGTIGETYIVPEKHRVGIINQALMKMKLVKEINMQYFLLYFDYILKHESKKLSSGSAIKNIPPFEVFKQMLIPLPPLEEQQRIVDKIEELFAKLDELKPIEEELNELKKDFPKEMRKAILNSAISGNLVKNSTDSDSVNLLLNKISDIKQEKIKNNTLKEESNVKYNYNVKFDIPKNWRWVRLGDYCEKVTDQVASGSFKSIRDNVPSLKTIDYALMVKTADFSNNFSKNLTYTTEHAYNFLSNSNLFGGELIMSNIGSIGKIFIVPNLNMKMTLAPNTVMLRFTNERLRDYIFYYFQSSYGLKSLLSITSGTTMKKFNKTDLKNLMIPIPPLEEQQRIVDKLEQLLPLCDDIETIIGE